MNTPHQAHSRAIAWITWEDHRRTREIARALDLDLNVLEYSGGRWSRYSTLALRTLRFLGRTRPRVLVVQNPSIALTALAALLRGVYGYRLVVDAHNEAVDPYIHTAKPIRWLSRRLLRAADLTVVTNSILAEMVRRAGGTPAVLPDRVPTPPHSEGRRLSEKFNLVLISTFAPDEPLEAILEAVASVGDHLLLHVTGDHGKLSARHRALAGDNVHFKGYLNEHDYWELLRSADGVLDLTLMDNCLVCGAYEALAVGKPMILSANEATMRYFGPAAIYVENSAADIARGLRDLLEQHATLSTEIDTRRTALEKDWQGRAEELRATLATLRGS